MKYKKCSLPEDINKCPFCNKEKMECKIQTGKTCAFQYDDSVVKDNYVRQERWFEKYYKK